MKIQWLHLPYPQIVHSGPKDSVRFFLQNTSFSLKMTLSFPPRFFPVTSDYLIFTLICPFSPLEIISSFSPTIFPSHSLLTDSFGFTSICRFPPLQINSHFTHQIPSSSPDYLNFTWKCSFSPLKFYPQNLSFLPTTDKLVVTPTRSFSPSYFICSPKHLICPL